MGLESNTGLNVYNYYGPRNIEDGVQPGKTRTSGFSYELVLFVTVDNYADVSAVIPAGSIVREAFAEVETAFTFTGGTTPAMEIGTSGTEATNGTGLNLTSTGTEEGTLAGTWQAALAAATTVNVVTSGAPDSVNTGKAKVVIRYDIVE